MATRIETPIPLVDLGESVNEATVTRWLKQPGDELQAGEPLLEVSTDKVDTEVVAPVDGTLLRILAAEGVVVAVGDALAVIAEGDVRHSDGNIATATDGQNDSAPVAERPTNGEGDDSKTVEETAQPKAVAAVVPTPADVSSGGVATEKLPRIRRTIARRMMESLQTSAQLTTVIEVDASAVADLRRRHKDDFLHRTGVRLSFLPFFVKAAVDVLADHRVINSSLNADVTEVTYHRNVHLGIAVDSPKGLMVPVIRDAENLSVGGLARSISDVAERVRTGSIKPEELSGGTFTITNTGSRGALFDTPIINQPQSAILGVGAVVERVVPSRVDGNLQIGVRSMTYLSLSYDHRIVDGADAARYLGAVKASLEKSISAPDLSI